MPEIINPEKECKRTPEKFSGESKIIDVKKTDFHRGIVLDSVEEFGQALTVYNGGSVQGARATQSNLMDAVGDRGGGMGAGMLVLAGAKNAGGFIERLVQEATSALQETGRFNKHFEYDGTGTNFFKTTIVGRQVGDKYVLELNAAYVGTEPEDKLAETLGKSKALVYSSAKGLLSIIDDWWFNVNLEKISKNLPIPQKEREKVEEWTEYIASGGFKGKSPEFEIEHGGQKIALTMGLDAKRHLKPEGERDNKYMQARGNSIVGGAWTTWDETGSNEVEPRAVQPSVILSVSMPGERYLRSSAVTTEDIKVLYDARDYIAELISPK